MTKNLMAALAGLGLLAGVSAVPAQAQVPGGSYLQTCTNVHQRGDRLVAECRRIDGGWERTAIDTDRCRGGIANTNGQLTCGGGGGAAWRHDRWDNEGYGSSRAPRDYGYGQSGYGQRDYWYGR